MDMDTVLDVGFRLLGDQVPVDHSYALYAAICNLLPALHGDKKVGIHPINGRLIGGRMLGIGERSRLTLRVEADRIKDVLPLAGKTLDVGGHKLQVGVPDLRVLMPAARLYSRLVIIKGFTEAEGFLAAARRQLGEAAIKGHASLVDTSAAAAANEGRSCGTNSTVLRRTLRIRDKTIVGFAMRVKDLTDDDSIRLQEVGIGGRRRFGCGVFTPDRKTS
jgi:CRISPR-associated protein Cas6